MFNHKLTICKNYEDMSKKAADYMIKRFDDLNVLGLATGSTPIGLYENLAKAVNDGKISFEDKHSVNLDEYINIPLDHKERYAVFMEDNLFSKIDMPKENHNVPFAESTEDNVACKKYDELIDSLGGVDLQILGIGQNGHIAFNEPDDELEFGTYIVKLTDSTIKANSRFFETEEQVPKYAISMGVGKILEAKEIILLASGKSKNDALRSLLEDSKITTKWPVTLLKLHNNVHVFADEEAMDNICVSENWK